MTYIPAIKPKSSRIELRGLETHVLSWGPEEGPLLIMLHGWGDCAAGFQFLVDAMDPSWRIVAPDWRGFGLTSRALAGYWFPDYLADLEALADHYSPDGPLNLLGHSMGGNVASLYAGIRPGRVAQLVNIEGFGLPDASPEMAPERYAKWLSELGFNDRSPKAYDSLSELAQRLVSRHPLIPAERAQYLAGQWGFVDKNGRVQLRMDPTHRRVNPVLYRREEARSCWRRVSARVLVLLGEQSHFRAREGYESLDLPAEHMPNARLEEVPDAGHMLHIEQPEATARAIQGFLE